MKISELLSSPDKWTQHACARLSPDTDDLPRLQNPPVESDHPGAVCWCLIGAVEKCYGPSGTLEFNRTVGKLLHHLGKIPDPHNVNAIANWNDARERSHAQVLELALKADL